MAEYAYYYKVTWMLDPEDVLVIGQEDFNFYSKIDVCFTIVHRTEKLTHNEYGEQEVFFGEEVDYNFGYFGPLENKKYPLELRWYCDFELNESRLKAILQTLSSEINKNMFSYKKDPVEISSALKYKKKISYEESEMFF